MKNVILNVTSHKMTEEQVEDAKNLGCDKIVDLPENLKKLWSQVPTGTEGDVGEHLLPIISWIEDCGWKGCQNVLVSGDFSATFFIVNKASKINIECWQSATERVSVDLGEGKKMTQFKHIRFRSLSKMLRLV